jgi:hypothetical protein
MDNNWSSIGSFRELERKAKEHNLNEASKIAQMALMLIQNLKYLSGCVVKGRGTDIDKEHPARNVFEYVKELEAKAEQAEAQIAEAVRECERIANHFASSSLAAENVAEGIRNRFPEYFKEG